MSSLPGASIHDVIDGVRECNKCHITKSLNEFYRRNGANDRNTYYRHCKVCHNELTRLNNKRNKEQHRKATQKSRFKIKYGISLEDFTALYKKQNGICANVNCNFIGDLVVDHCHSTGKVRGLLCRSCNLALGHVQDNIDLLDGLADYLERSL